MSKTTKHAPGLRTVGKPRSIAGCRGIPIVFDIGVKPHPVCADVWDEGMEDGEAEANARLIAAAPDLLNACREALQIRSLAYQVDANPKLDILTRREIERKVDGIIERIEAAIAKAEGNEQ